MLLVGKNSGYKKNTTQNQVNDWEALMPLFGKESGISQNEKQVNLKQKRIVTPSAKIYSAENKISEIQVTTISEKKIQQRITDAQKKQNKSLRDDDEMILYIVLAIFIPPLAVYLYEDSIGTNFWIDLILTLLFWLPGVIFAFLVIAGVV